MPRYVKPLIPLYKKHHHQPLTMGMKILLLVRTSTVLAIRGTHGCARTRLEHGY
jgi:hypothetical protein